MFHGELLQFKRRLKKDECLAKTLFSGSFGPAV